MTEFTVDDLFDKNDVFINSKISLNTWKLTFYIIGFILGLGLCIFNTVMINYYINDIYADQTIVYNITDVNDNIITLECYLKDFDNCKCDNVTYNQYYDKKMDITKCNNYFKFLQEKNPKNNSSWILMYILFGYILTIYIFYVFILYPIFWCIAHILKCCGYSKTQQVTSLLLQNELRTINKV